MQPAIGPWGQPLSLVAPDGIALHGAVLAVPGARAHAILLPGRTEFVEKYAAVAKALAARGLSVAAVDWRGQGASARLLADPMIGHVGRFADFHTDLDTLLAHPDVAALPGPRLLVAHSMGGCIALGWLLSRAAHGVTGAVFSAPMLGLRLRPPFGFIAPGLARLAVRLGLARFYAPGGGPKPYALGPFENNLLTGDATVFAELGAWLRAHPSAGLGGPSFGWLAASFDEMHALRGRPVPVPALFAVGTEEGIVDALAVRRAADAPGARLVVLEGARHEGFIETAQVRAALWAAIDGFLADVLR